jgi:cytosine/adenosine deaminase-related metal-dependent hydrolase
MATPPLAFRARLVVPIDSPPLDGGYITVAGERIVAVGRDKPDGPIHDLGDAAVLPGLVNTHVHLEYSDLGAPLGRPGMAFPEWIRLVVDYKRTAGGPQVAAIERGLRESLRAGVTTLGEIASPGWPIEPFVAWPGNVTVFQELIGLATDRIEERMAAAQAHLTAGARGPWQAGLSPHAPYTVHPDLLARVVRLAAEQARSAPIALHLAESPEELQLLRDGSGAFRELLNELGAWDATAIAPGSRPLDYLRMLAAGPRSLVIHGNYLDDEEIAFAAAHADRMTVVYCPRTHAWFGHAPHPLPRLLAAGASVALGTDGRASNPDLSLWEEMRLVSERFPQLPVETILRLGTLDGARALGRDGAIGSLSPGKLAEFVVIRAADGAAPRLPSLLADQANCVSTLYRRGICCIVALETGIVRGGG